MVNETPPEEKLLRLIRGKPKKSDGASSSLEARPKEYTSNRPSKTHDFYRVGVVLLILIAVSGIGYTIFESMLPQPSLKMKDIHEAASEDKIDKDSTEILSAKPYSYYSEYIDSRDVFKADFLSAKGITDALDGSLEGKLFNLTLVGIVLDDIPQAIIEHEKDQKTYFLKKGDSIDEVRVEDISEGKVTISFEDEEFELKP